MGCVFQSKFALKTYKHSVTIPEVFLKPYLHKEGQQKIDQKSLYNFIQLYLCFKWSDYSPPFGVDLYIYILAP